MRRRRSRAALRGFPRLPASLNLRKYLDSLDVTVALILVRATNFPGEQHLGIRQMNRPLFSHRLTAVLIAFFALALTAGVAAAQSAGELESQLSSLQGQMSSAESNEATADEVISKLDSAEADFAKLTSSGRVDKGALIPIFHQLEEMLDRIQTVYLKKKDDCINRSTTAGNATTTSPSNTRCVPPIRSHGCGSPRRPRCSTTTPNNRRSC